MKISNNFFGAFFIVMISINASAQNTDINNIKNHLKFLASDDLKGRGFGSPEGKIASEYIASQFRAAGIEPYLDDYFYGFDERIGVLNIRGRNVIGLIKGNDPVLSNEYIVLGAHYDHIGWNVEDKDTLIYNGADDNASGVSGIIEIGRYLAQNREQLKRSVILIAFDGEESGLKGSWRIVRDSILDIPAVKAMFSLDMIGMYSVHKGLDLEGIKQIENYALIVDKAKEKSPVDILKMNDRIVPNTDTQPFGMTGIPAIHVFTGTESPYHKPEDVDSLLDYEGMVKVCDFVSALTVELSQKDEIIFISELKPGKPGMKVLNPGLTIKNGKTFYNYPDDFFRSKSIYALSAGFFLETRITQFLAIQPEVIYEMDGGQQASGNLRTHSISTPLSLLLTSPDPSNMGFRAYFQLGGYYTYTFSGKLDKNDIDFTTDFNDQQYGMLIGWGFEMKNFRLGYLQKTSFVNFMQDDALGNMMMKGNYVSLGWAF